MKTGSQYSGRVRLRTCGLLIQNESILLVKQNVPTMNEPVWIPPGGGVELGESLDETLAREVFEETRLQISDVRLRYIHEFIQPPFHAVEFYYIVNQFNGRLKTGSDPERQKENQDILDALFAPYKYLSGWNVHPRFLIEEIKNQRLENHGITRFRTVRNTT
ncbi:NUDIX domain-containing protein [Rhodohalobacter mucosus]|uniref:NUDIX hydrolase n=1 Tax=Rhodohalobacter mucosus TaxID=2079485 RepID=A0A316TKS9_9BACT|nr:NUDIX domain-containing protein [Rhodohalobacter mucosus]PWN05147.1 NUDIX hydrolase [Rhodohalobacter mucosus]